MGTRSITHIHGYEEFGGDVECSFYRQYDGYPSGHGLDLAKWLLGKKIVNGINSTFNEGVEYNGAGQMAISLMYDLLQDTSVRVIKTGESNHGEDFTYSVRFKDGDSIIGFSDCDDEGDQLKKFNLTPQEVIDKYGKA